MIITLCGNNTQNLRDQLTDSKKLGGVFSGGVPPDSIPNSEVKPACGENSAEVALCQNSTMPPFNLKSPSGSSKFGRKAKQKSDPSIVYSVEGFLFLLHARQLDSLISIVMVSSIIKIGMWTGRLLPENSRIASDKERFVSTLQRISCPLTDSGKKGLSFLNFVCLDGKAIILIPTNELRKLLGTTLK